MDNWAQQLHNGNIGSDPNGLITKDSQKKLLNVGLLKDESIGAALATPLQKEGSLRGAGPANKSKHRLSKAKIVIPRGPTMEA